MKELTRRRFAVSLFAPRMASWWVYLVAVALGAVSLVTSLWHGIVRFPSAGVTGVVLAVPVGVAWWWLLRLPQLWMRLSRSAAVAAVVWGATAGAGLYALPANGAIMTLLGQHASVGTAQTWGAALAAPLTEETGKAFAIAMVVLLSRQRLRTPMDGALIAAFAGLGFTLAEDVLYGFNTAYLSFGESPVISTMVVFFLRAVLFAAVSHVVFSAFVGAGVAWLVTGSGVRRVPLGLAFVVTGPTLHLVWNSPWLTSIWARVVYLVVVPFLVWGALRVVRSEESAWFRRILQRPGALGDIPAAYVGAVRATWWKRRAYRKDVARSYGPAALAVQRRLEAELTDLADAVAMGDDDAAAAVRASLEARLATRAT